MTQQKDVEEADSAIARQTEDHGLSHSVPTNILDSVDVPIIVVARNCTVVRFNRAAESVVGCRATDIGHPFTHIRMFKDRREFSDLCARVLAGGAPCRYEFKYGEKQFVLRIAAVEQQMGGALLTLMNVTAFQESIKQAIDDREFTKAILNTVWAPLVLVDADLRVQTANREFFRMFQVSREEAQGTPLPDLKYHTWDPVVWRPVKEILSDHREFQPLEVDHEFPTIGLRTVLIDARRFNQWGEANEMVLIVFQDITERKQAEEALRRSERNLSDFFDNATVGLHWIGPTGIVLRVNQTELDLLGYAREEYLGHHIAEFHVDQSVIQDILTRLMDGKSLHEYSARLRCKDGSIREVLINSNALFEDGQFVHTRCFTRDVTARKKAETALRQQRAQFETLLNQAPLGVYLVDADFRFIQVNPTALPVFGNIGDLIGRDFDEVTHRLWTKEYADEIVRIFHHTLESGEPYVTPERAEFRIDRSVTEYYEWRVDRITLPDGRYGLVCYFRDISMQVQTRRDIAESAIALQRLNNELELRVDERTRELVFSQERLRALTIELNLTEQRERNRLAAELHDHLQQLLVLGKLKLGQGKRMAQGIPACSKLIHETDEVLAEALKYTRTLVSELSPPVLREHGLAPGLRWLAEYMQRYEMMVTIDAPEGIQLQLAEDQIVLLYQSVRELLINAMKHAGTGEATVKLERQAGELRIEVHDEGPGFDLAVDPTAKAFTGGQSQKFGLLSIRERMKALGGRFELAPGKGTTAILILPLTTGAETTVHGTELPRKAINHDLPSERSAIKAQHSGPNEKRIRVLLVDDHVMMRQGLQSVLESYPDVELVGEAGDGAEALTLIERVRPSVVVMDINMPKMNGIEATALIKARHPGIIVFGLSVNAGGDNLEQMMKAGAVRVLTKEAAVDDLYNALHAAVYRDASHDSERESASHPL